ncbi:ComF family protein [Persicobacter sp. CCB-QB2]|uniref:ComF family protein n=1 Tax=Persicobacter sp. CCB-QB2 TaxID=1561025 RepID=UPI0006A97AA4|nr:ComF family protein [Persicobacter sp. CCB-QB2]
MKILKVTLAGVKHLLFPPYCLCCDAHIPFENALICMDCELDLSCSMTDSDREVKVIFYDMPQVKGLYIAFQFFEDSRVQKLIHYLKYKHYPEVGELLGCKLGRIIKRQQQPFDFIIPVPIHPKKRKIRGYNQAEHIAKGVMEETGIPLAFGLLKKQRHSSSQTKLNKEERIRNVERSFGLRKKLNFKGKRVLLVDDVLTTGATLRALVQVLIEAKADHIEIGVLGKAEA